MNGTYVSDGIDVDVVFGILWMWYERLDQELSQDAFDALDLLWLACAGLDPFSGFRPSFVESKESALSTALDQLIWLSHELGTWSQQPGICDFGLVKHIPRGCVFREIERGQS